MKPTSLVASVPFMDETVGSYEAKTRLAAALDRVEGGETPTIARNGESIARLVPAPPRHLLPGTEANALVERFRDLREAMLADGVRPFTTEEIVGLIHEGRKY